MAKIVKYHNDLNSVILKGYGLNELDIFYAIIFKMKNKTEAVFTVNEIKSLTTNVETKEKTRSLEKFFGYLDNVFKTQLQVTTKSTITDYHLFITKKLDREKKEIIIKLHPDCTHILNDLLKNYTKFDLEDFLKLNSEYSKTLFKLLKQYSDTNFFKMTMTDFRTIFEVPESYEQGNIDQKILKPCIKELEPFFKNLKYQKHKTKATITGISFTWEKEMKRLDFEDSETKSNDEDIQKINLALEMLAKSTMFSKHSEELEKIVKDLLQRESKEIIMELLKRLSKYKKEIINIKAFVNTMIENIKKDDVENWETTKAKNNTTEAKMKREEEKRLEKALENSKLEEELNKKIDKIMSEQSSDLYLKSKAEALKHIENYPNMTLDQLTRQAIYSRLI